MQTVISFITSKACCWAKDGLACTAHQPSLDSVNLLKLSQVWLSDSLSSYCACRPYCLHLKQPYECLPLILYMCGLLQIGKTLSPSTIRRSVLCKSCIAAINAQSMLYEFLPLKCLCMKQWKSEYVAYPAGQSSCPGDSVNLLKLSQSKSDQVICAWKPSRAPRTKFRAFCKGFTWYMESSQLARVLSHRTSHLFFLYACKHWLAVYNVQSMLHEHLPLWKMA